MSIARRLNGRSIEAPIAGAMAFCAGFALAAAPAEAGMPGLTGADRPDDVIQARQWLMAGVESEMLAIDMADGGRKFEFSDLQSRAYMISTLLTAFPHLFPPETKPQPLADGSPSPTAAAPAIWEDFDELLRASAGSGRDRF